MTEKKFQAPRISMSHTKKEMLAAYQELVKQLEARREAEVRPEQKIEEKAVRQVTAVADGLSTEGIVREIGNLRAETSKLLSQVSDRLEEEVGKYEQIKKAITAKEKELSEIYEIERSASSLAALIEAQHQKRQEFEADMAARKEALTQEIEITRAQWEEEKKRYQADIKERDAAEKNRREREQEEYRYTFEREQRLARDKFEDEKAGLERELHSKREQMERDLADREKAIAQQEQELNELRDRVAAFPEELDTAVNEAVQEAVERIQAEAQAREELLKKEFEGERNVLLTRIEALEKTVKEQNTQMTKYSQQLEKAYSQVQDIAVKAIEGSGNKTLAGLQQLMAEQTRKLTPDR